MARRSKTIKLVQIHIQRSFLAHEVPLFSRNLGIFCWRRCFDPKIHVFRLKTVGIQNQRPFLPLGINFCQDRLELRGCGPPGPVPFRSSPFYWPFLSFPPSLLPFHPSIFTPFLQCLLPVSHPVLPLPSENKEYCPPCGRFAKPSPGERERFHFFDRGSALSSRKSLSI